MNRGQIWVLLGSLSLLAGSLSAIKNGVGYELFNNFVWNLFKWLRNLIETKYIYVSFIFLINDSSAHSLLKKYEPIRNGDFDHT